MARQILNVRLTAGCATVQAEVKSVGGQERKDDPLVGFAHFRKLVHIIARSFSMEVLHAGVAKCEAIRGERAIEQLSLLRTRMKADLGVFGIHYGGGLRDTDKSFLKDCGELLWHRRGGSRSDSC